MAGPITFVPPFFPEKEGASFISLAKGEITPEMCNSIEEIRAFKGSSQEVEVFLGDMIKELVIHALSDPTARDVT